MGKTQCSERHIDRTDLNSVLPVWIKAPRRLLRELSPSLSAKIRNEAPGSVEPR